MKLCFAKQPYCAEYTWESTKWSGPQALVDALTFRTQNISLAVHCEADTWVLDGQDGWFHTVKQCNPEGLDALYAAHTAIPVHQVPWRQYDVVITTDPIVPWHVIKQRPEVLWCYYECGHTSQSAWRSRRAPREQYDLYLDHFMYTRATEIARLPQSVQFPYLANAEILQGLVDIPAVREGILFDSKTRGTVKADLPVFMSKGMGRIGHFHRAVARRQLTSPAKWLQLMARCKYFLLWREGPIIGQAAIEAAAMGMIVVAGQRAVYPSMMCHPDCLLDVEAKRQPHHAVSGQAAIERIECIEAQPECQAEILAYQHERLEELFWRKPLAMLERAVEMKRSG